MVFDVFRRVERFAAASRGSGHQVNLFIANALQSVYVTCLLRDCPRWQYGSWPRSMNAAGVQRWIYFIEDGWSRDSRLWQTELGGHQRLYV